MCVSCCPPWDQVRNNFNIEWEFQNLNKRQLVPSRWQTTAFLLNMRVEARFLGRASLLKMIPTMHAWIITPTIDWKCSQSLCSRGDGKVDRRKQQNPSGSRTKTRYQCQECVAGFPKVTPWAVACFLYLSQTQAKHFPLLCSVFCLFFLTLNKLKKNYPLLLFFSCFMLCFLFLNIISTQENIPHYFPSSPAKLGNNKSRRNSRANGAATQSFELNFSSTRSFIAGFQSFGMFDVQIRTKT